MTLRGGAVMVGSLLLIALSAAAAPPTTNESRAIEREARRALENGRALILEDRADAAERVLRRGLKRSPEDHRLERALAHALDALGKAEAARTARARADALAPRPPPPPRTPLLDAAADRLILLVRDAAEHPETPGPWPDDSVETQLTARIEARLPGATVLRADPESVAEGEALLRERGAKRVLSLRVDRAYCGFSIKDGQLAIADLHAVVAIEGGPVLEIPTRTVVEDPLPRAKCEGAALDLALEAALVPLVGQPPANARQLGGPRARALFPDLDRRITLSLRRGRTRLAAGRLDEAIEAFEAALQVDPKDPIARAHRDDARESLALAAELTRTPEADSAAQLDPRLSPGQRAAVEIALRREQERRDQLLAALAVLDEDVVPPSDDALAKLPAVDIRMPEAFGPVLAREKAQGAVKARAAYAPDGGVIARYYFPTASAAPVLREEDTNGDGAADRWISYSGSARHEIFEDRFGRGRPDLRLVFAATGNPLERVEIDWEGDGNPDRVFAYRTGMLIAENADTDGDGRLDRFDHFDLEGRVELREEDLDGDGVIDIRSEFEHGKLVRREVSGPEYLPES